MTMSLLLVVLVLVVLVVVAGKQLVERLSESLSLSTLLRMRRILVEAEMSWS